MSISGEMTLLLYIERQLNRAARAEVSAHHARMPTFAVTLLAGSLEREIAAVESTRECWKKTKRLTVGCGQFQERARKSMQWILGEWFLNWQPTGGFRAYTNILSTPGAATWKEGRIRGIETC